MKSLVVSCLLTVLAATGAWGETTLKQAQALFKPVPARPPVLAKNPATPAKVELGKMQIYRL